MGQFLVPQGHASSYIVFQHLQRKNITMVAVSIDHAAFSC